MIMHSTSNIQVRVDTKLKKQAEKLLESMGLDISTLIRMTLKRTVLMKNLPFPMGHNEEIDENGFTKAQLKELEKALKDKKTYGPFTNAEDLIKSLNS